MPEDAVGTAAAAAPKKQNKKQAEKEKKKKSAAKSAAAKSRSKPKLTKEERREKYTQIARDRRERNFSKKRDQNLVCFRCRKRGHSASDCKAAENDDGHLADEGGRSGGGRMCYKCGSTEHGLDGCPRLRNASRTASKRRIDYSKIDLPFAQCFICNKAGHLASQCENNDGKGIFVDGGSCRKCGSKLHIAADCTDGVEKGRKDTKHDDPESSVSIENLLEVEDEPSSVRTGNGECLKKKKKRVINF